MMGFASSSSTARAVASLSKAGKGRVLVTRSSCPSPSLVPLRSLNRDHTRSFASSRESASGASSSSKSSGSRAALSISLALLAGAVGGYLVASPLQLEAGARSTYPGPSSPPISSSFPQALSQLKQHFADEQDCVSTEPTDLEAKGFSLWCQHDASLPQVVVYPTCTDDVVAIVNIARENGVALVPFAGGTCLEAHWYAPRDPKTGETIPTISMAFERMDALLEHDEDSGYVRVQPGLGWQDLNEDLKSRGSKLFWPVDPGPGSAFGGMLATGGSGTGAVRYGTMKGDLILNVTVVLPSGEVIKTRSDARKSSVGPDLTKLFLGSEGTLGVITEVTLRLVPRLKESVVTVAFDSVDQACRASQAILNHGVGVSSIELLDDVMLKAINFASKPDPPHAERPSLFIKFSGSDVHTSEDQRLTRKLVAEHGADLSTLRTSRDEAEVEALWESRKVALWSAMQYRGEGARCWTTDCCVPIARLPDYMKQVKEDLAKSNLVAPIVSHVGDGNFHALIVYKDGDKEEFARAKDVVHRMVHLAQDLGGTATGEHGVGRGKREYLERELGPGTVQLLRSIKNMLDPTGFMNPGTLLLPEGGDVATHAH